MAKKAEKNLVIVESPAKAKTIGKYLGPSYQVKACMGHLRDLPKSKLGVDVDNDFEPDYRPIKGKEDIIRDLRAAADESAAVYLATDPDREGEAISWHLKYLLELPDERAHRVTFNEITRKVVTESIAAPREIDQNLVDAQQARRILDRIVGYQLSPLLWKKIRRGLSAGRVQSVAMRLVADREKEIRDFVPQEYWTLDAMLRNDAGVKFCAHYYGQGGKKYEPQSQADIERIQQELRDLPFAVRSVKRTDKKRSPSPPFSTSTLQQEASRKLNMTPRRTMAIAQQLYEGVDITGEGTVGLITYMRTDSLRISEEAQAAARDFIDVRYGPDYRPKTARQYKTKAGAQDAHEAIRPSNVTLTPEQVKGDLTGEQYRLYRLIWSRFLASQMANAVYDSVSVELAAGEHTFRASASSLKFAGYTAVYEESRDDEKEEKEPALPELHGAQDAAMVGYRLKNTVSPFGTVTRGVCATENGLLRKVHETYKIQLCPDGTIRDTSGAGAGVALDPEALVSMNMWGYHPAMLDVMAQYFDAFVRDLAPGDEKRECLLPVMMDALTAQGRVNTRVLQTSERWFGLTYQDDKPGVVAALRALHADGTYPPALWK